MNLQSHSCFKCIEIDTSTSVSGLVPIPTNYPYIPIPMRGRFRIAKFMKTGLTRARLSLWQVAMSTVAWLSFKCLLLVCKIVCNDSLGGCWFYFHVELNLPATSCCHFCLLIELTSFHFAFSTSTKSCITPKFMRKFTVQCGTYPTFLPLHGLHIPTEDTNYVCP